MYYRLFALILFVSIASSVSASPLAETVGATSSSTPLMARFMNDSADATYFNPALLPLARRSFSFSLFFLYSDLNISLHKRDSGLNIVGDVDAGTGIYGAVTKEKQADSYTTNLPYKSRPTNDLLARGNHSNNDHELYASLGMSLPLYKNYIAVGATATLPLLSGTLQQNSFFNDEREQNFSNSLHFELYEDRLKIFNGSVGIGGGYKWIYGGVGLSVLSSTVINTSAFTPDAGKNENKIHADTTIKTIFRPQFGLVVQPWWKLRFTFTAHLQMQHDISSVNKLTFWYINREQEKEIDTNILTVNQAFKPLTLSTGLGFVDADFGRVKLSLGLLMTWRQWSHYRDRYDEAPQDNVYWDYSVREVKDDGTEVHGGWVTETVDDMRWKDTFDFVLGSTVKIDKHTIGADLGYHPSPVPDQVKRTNYVDNDKITFDVTYSYEWALAKKLSMETGILFGAQFFITRETNKIPGVANSYGKGGTVVDEFPDSVSDPFNPEKPAQDGDPDPVVQQSAGFQTNNPGYPGFTSSGALYNIGLWIKLLF